MEALKAAPHTGVMVAFYVPRLVAEALARQTRAAGVTPVPTTEMHCTLVFLGDTAQLSSSKFQILAGVERYARWASAVIGQVGGVGRFETVESDGTNALYASVDAPTLQDWRDNLVQTLADQSGILPASDHGYTPHITLAYLPEDVPTPTLTDIALPLTFLSLSVAWGEERFDFPLTQASPLVFKDATGALRWVTQSSSAFRDRDGEIVSTKALTDDVTRADQDGAYGPLRWWHQPGIDLGDCDFNAVIGRVLVESGTFRSQAVGERVKQHAAQLQVSIGFLHPTDEPDESGVFSHIKRFERSLLPAGFASNLYTQVLTLEEQPMDEQKKEAARLLFGDDLLEKLILQSDTTEKQAEADGVAFKAGEKQPEPKAAPPKDAPEPPKAPDGAAPPADSAPPPPPGQTGGTVGELNVAAFTEVMKSAQQPMVDVLTALVNAFTGTAQQTVTKEVANAARIAAAEQDVATLKASLAKAEATVAELSGDLPRSLAERRASQSTTTLVKDGLKAADQPQPDTGFLGFLTGAQPQQGA